MGPRVPSLCRNEPRHHRLASRCVVRLSRIRRFEGQRPGPGSVDLFLDGRPDVLAARDPNGRWNESMPAPACPLDLPLSESKSFANVHAFFILDRSGVAEAGIGSPKASAIREDTLRLGNA